MLYQLSEKIELDTDILTAWAFFSNPHNLKLITPPELNLKITSNTDTEIYPGQIITYNVTPLLGISLNWVTEITQIREYELFVDEQRLGPYKIWHHEHHFSETERGVLVQDVVTYALPFGLIGKIMHEIIVKNQLKEIFQFRRDALHAQFNVLD